MKTCGILPLRVALKKRKKEHFPSLFLIMVVRTRDISSYLMMSRTGFLRSFEDKRDFLKVFIFHVSFKVNLRHLALLSRPVGTNLVLVRRVRANNLLSMKAERAERLTVRGPGALGFQNL